MRKYYIAFTVATILLSTSLLFLSYRVYRHDLSHMEQQYGFNLLLLSEQLSRKIKDSYRPVDRELDRLVARLKQDSGVATGPNDRKILDDALSRLAGKGLVRLEEYDSRWHSVAIATAGNVLAREPDSAEIARRLQDMHQRGRTVDVLPGGSGGQKTVLIVRKPFSGAETTAGGTLAALLDFEDTDLIRQKRSLNSGDLFFSIIAGRDRPLLAPVMTTTAESGRDTAIAIDPGLLGFLGQCPGEQPCQDEYREEGGRRMVAAASGFEVFGEVWHVVFTVSEEQVKNLLVHFHLDHVIATLCIILTMALGVVLAFRAMIRWNHTLQQEVEERKNAEREKEKLIGELQQALREIKVLSGFLPICASCKKIRNDQGYWRQLESYLSEHSDLRFSHGICPDCAKELYPGINIRHRG